MSGDEEAHHHGSIVRSLRGVLPSSHSEISASYMTCGAGPPCHRMGTPVCIGGDFP
jgi:hypothetical protein